MNKGIKLRAWDSVNKEMWTNTFPSMDWKIGNEIIRLSDFSDEHIEKNVKFMLSSGVVDINKKEIYWGDIITRADLKINYRVIFHNGAFIYIKSKRNTQSMKMIHPVAVHKYKIEVIGNIFQDPHLLPSDYLKKSPLFNL